MRLLKYKVNKFRSVKGTESIAGSVDELCNLGYALKNTRLTDRAIILLIKDTTQAAICG